MLTVKFTKPCRSDELEKQYIIDDPKQTFLLVWTSPAVAGFSKKSLKPLSVDEEGLLEDVKLRLIEMQCDDTPRSCHQQLPFLQINRGLEKWKFPPDEAPCQNGVQFIWLYIHMWANTFSYDTELGQTVWPDSKFQSKAQHHCSN